MHGAPSVTDRLDLILPNGWTRWLVFVHGHVATDDSRENYVLGLQTEEQGTVLA
jgi:hypothetical protein